MAHQAHAIPWQTLADNLKFTPANSRYMGITNLYPRSKPGQAKQLQHFARVFASVLSEYAAIERKKYDAEYTAPGDDEVIISDSVAKNIENVVKEYMKEAIKDDPSLEQDPLPRRRRTIRPWIVASTWNSCHPSGHLLETDELLRTLILRGEMNTLFRITKHPEVRLNNLWQEGRKFAFDIGGYGFSQVKESALLAYICLNVFHLKPELHDPTMRARMLRAKAARNEPVFAPCTYDYRLTSAYQQMLVFCAGTGYPYAHYGAHKLPHREFFGVPYGMYTLRVHWHSHTPYTIPISPYGKSTTLNDLVDAKFPHKYIPSKNDVSLVTSLLRDLGLPVELVTQILDFAAYMPRGRLRVRDDPLHVHNADELEKYLGYCWMLLVRTQMVLAEAGWWLDWEAEVVEAVYKLFGTAYPKMSEVVRGEVDGGFARRPGEVDQGRARRRFV